VPEHLEKITFPWPERAFWPMNPLSTTGFIGIKAPSSGENTDKGAHAADANRALGQRQMPKGRLSSSKLLPVQWFWRSLHPAMAVASGESDHGKSDLLANRAELALAVRGVYAGAIRGDYRPGLIEAPPVATARAPAGPAIRGDYRPGLIEARSWLLPSALLRPPSGAITAPASLKLRERWHGLPVDHRHHPGRLPPRPH